VEYRSARDAAQETLSYKHMGSTCAGNVSAK